MAGTMFYFSVLYISGIFGVKRRRRFIVAGIFAGRFMRMHGRKISKDFKY